MYFTSVLTLHIAWIPFAVSVCGRRSRFERQQLKSEPMPRTPQSRTKSGTEKTQKQNQNQKKSSKIHNFPQLLKLPRIPKKKPTPKKDRQKRIKEKAKKLPKAGSATVQTPNDGVKTPATARSVNKSQPSNAMKTAEHLEEEDVCFHIEKSNNEKPEISTDLDSIIVDKNPLTKKTVQMALIKKIHDAETAEVQQAEAQNENNNRSVEGEEASINEVQQIEHKLEKGEDYALANKQRRQVIEDRSRYVLRSMSPKEVSLSKIFLYFCRKSCFATVACGVVRYLTAVFNRDI
ncbi:unnamed protein product [Cylicocyclus nassatus]|uniref:Uncharacterized protein n=1 Tax=Cylicocyclus nassatus TaxID=53992 RepID=A0AA36DLF1_CYLNA|nr:unnamed protein product [Cylicocyclus nassatus]